MSQDMIMNLIERHEQIINVITESFKLYNNQVIRQGLSAISRIVMIGKPMILIKVQESVLQNELNWLIKHKIVQISQLALAIKQICFRDQL